jgi:dolichyl-phosphate beta-glucosyltransferase
MCHLPFLEAGMPLAPTIDHDLTLIIPAYNEAARLPRSLAQAKSTLDDWKLDYRVLVVDNNSSDGTGRIPNQFGSRFDSIRVPTPGKGAAVRTAMLAATGRVLAFTDADLPFDLTSLREGYELVGRQTCDAAFGARDLAASSVMAQRSIWRRMATWGFRRVVRALVSATITDTQCGLKIFSHAAAREIFSRTTIDGFAFDAEVIFLAERLGFRCERIPVTLINEEGSTISLRRHALPMLLDVLRVQWRAWRGVYDPEEGLEPVLLPFPTSAAPAERRRAA